MPVAGCLAQLVRALRLHRRCRGFESLSAHKKSSVNAGLFLFPFVGGSPYRDRRVPQRPQKPHVIMRLFIFLCRGSPYRDRRVPQRPQKTPHFCEAFCFYLQTGVWIAGEVTSIIVLSSPALLTSKSKTNARRTTWNQRFPAKSRQASARKRVIA